MTGVARHGIPNQATVPPPTHLQPLRPSFRTTVQCSAIQERSLMSARWRRDYRRVEDETKFDLTAYEADGEGTRDAQEQCSGGSGRMG